MTLSHGGATPLHDQTDAFRAFRAALGGDHDRTVAALVAFGADERLVNRVARAARIAELEALREAATDEATGRKAADEIHRLMDEDEVTEL